MIYNCSNFNPVEIASGTYAYASTTCEITGDTSGTITSVAGGFTYGEIVTTVLLFLIFISVTYSFFYITIRKLNVRQ